MKVVKTASYEKKAQSEMYKPVRYWVDVMLKMWVEDPEKDAYLASEGEYMGMDPQQRDILLQQKAEAQLEEVKQAIDAGLEGHGAQIHQVKMSRE